MKINLYTNTKDKIDGYENINVFSELEKVKKLPDNSSEDIIAHNVFFLLDYLAAKELLDIVIKKCRRDSVFRFTILDACELGNAVLDKEISIEEFSKIISYAKSVQDLAYFIKTINESDIEIVTITKKNGFLNIEAKRRK